VHKHAEPARFQAAHGALQEQQVLENSARQGDSAQAAPLAQQHAAVLDQCDKAIVEASRDDFPGHAGR
jgi:hypothetical protein